MNELNQLAVKARTGDRAAAAELRRELEGHMAHIIRRAMRARDNGSRLGHRILAEAVRIAPKASEWPSEDRAALEGRIARRVCDSVMGNLREDSRADFRVLETVRG
jgi:hypothetical protein